MGNLEVVKRISTIKLESSLENGIGNTWKSKNRIVWGAGVSGKSFVEMYEHLGFSYIVDTRQKLQNSSYKNVSIVSPDKLYQENPEDTIVFLPTILCQELAVELNKKGFYNLVMPNQLNKSGVGFVIDSSDVYPFFNWLNENKIKYALLRWYDEDLLTTKDVDLMIDTEDIAKLLECDFLLKTNKKDSFVYLDVKWSVPVGLNIELPYFPIKLAENLLKNENIELKNGVKIIKDNMVIYSYIFHILFQKAEISGLSIDGELQIDNKYYNILNELRSKCNLSFEISFQGLWDFIMKSEFKPPIDFVRKWADENKSPFLNEKTKIKQKEKGLSKAVFIFREWYKNHPKILEESINIILKHGFSKVDLVYLNDQQTGEAKKNIRGGVWEETFDSRLGGGPYIVGVFEHDNTTSTRPPKEAIRKYISKITQKNINSIHASDDEIEALEYLEFIN